MAESSRERLIQTADRLFYEHGFHAIGLDRVIGEVGVTKTTFYNHFESKDDLILAVLDARDRREISEWMGIMRTRAGAEPRQRMLVLFDILHEWYTKEEFRGCMFINATAQFPAPHDPIHLAAGKHGERLYQEVRDMAAQAGAAEPDVLAAQLMLVVAGVLVSQHSAKSPEISAAARAMAELLIDRHIPNAGAGTGD